DATCKNLILARRGVEGPLARGFLSERNWEGVIVCPDVEHLAAYFDLAPAMHLVVGGDEVLETVFIFYRVSRKEHIFGVGAEDGKQRALVARFCRVQERGARVSWRRESLLDDSFGCRLPRLVT